MKRLTKLKIQTKIQNTNQIPPKYVKPVKSSVLAERIISFHICMRRIKFVALENYIDIAHVYNIHKSIMFVIFDHVYV